MAPSDLASLIGIVLQVTDSARRIRSLTVSSMARSRSRPTASGLAKSNRKRSGSTLLPACWACFPRWVCSAWCRTWVAECARRIASRRVASTWAWTVSPRETVPSTTWPTCKVKSLSFFVSVTRKRNFSPDLAQVTDLAATLAVERSAVEDEDDERIALVRSGGRLGQLPLLEDPDDLALGLGGGVAEELVAMMIRGFERIQRAGGEDVRGPFMGRETSPCASIALSNPVRSIRRLYSVARLSVMSTQIP